MKFKFKDKVVVTEGFFKGQTGTVMNVSGAYSTSLDGDRYLVRMPEASEFINETCLDLVTSENEGNVYV
jgi:hypothetical protein